MYVCDLNLNALTAEIQQVCVSHWLIWVPSLTETPTRRESISLRIKFNQNTPIWTAAEAKKYQWCATAREETEQSLTSFPTGHMFCEQWGFSDSLSVRMRGLGAFVPRAGPSLCGPPLWPAKSSQLKESHSLCLSLYTTPPHTHTHLHCILMCTNMWNWFKDK